MALEWTDRPRQFSSDGSIAPRVDWLLGPGSKSFLDEARRQNPDTPDVDLPLAVTVFVSIPVLLETDVSDPDYLPEFKERWPNFFYRLEAIKAQLVRYRVDPGNDKGQQTDQKGSQIPAPVKQSEQVQGAGDDTRDDLSTELPGVDDVKTMLSTDIIAFSAQLRVRFFDDVEKLIKRSNGLVVSVRPDSNSLLSREGVDSRFDPFIDELPEPLAAEQIDAGNGVDPTVIVAVIDDGIAIAHERFRGRDGKTRIEYAWLQEDDLQPRVTLETKTPAVASGSEWNKVDIDKLLDNCTTAGQVDEDRFYRDAGLANFAEQKFLPKPLAQRTAHGTHVMDLFCGYPASDAPDDRPIICVQLPREVTESTNSFVKDGQVKRAIDYIFARAEDIARKRAEAAGTEARSLPLVINFSYGNHAGPHDGTMPPETHIDTLVNARNNTQARTAVVIPSGNNFLARGHASMDFTGPVDPDNPDDPDDQGNKHHLSWRILPDDYTDSFLQIWFPEGALVSDYELKIVPPNGTTNPFPVGADEDVVVELRNTDGDVIMHSIFSDQKFAPKTSALSSRPMIEIALKGSASYDSTDATVPSGDWGIEITRVTELREQEGPVSTVEAWIERDDSPVGFRTGGRQSYFNNACYSVYDDRGRIVEQDDPDCVVKRFGNYNAVATGSTPMVVAAYTHKKQLVGVGDPLVQRRSIYSAAGSENPNRTPADAMMPDAAAPADDSYVHRGVIAAGSRSGSSVVLSGTSMAAPQLARHVAAHFAAGKPAVLSEVLQGALNPASVVVDPKSGYGHLKLTNAGDQNDPHGRISTNRRRLGSDVGGCAGARDAEFTT